MSQPLPIGAGYVLSLDDLVAFAQEGWHYPLDDDEATRSQIEQWLADRGIAKPGERVWLAQENRWQ